MGTFETHNTLETRTQGASATPTPRADAGESVGTRAGVILVAYTLKNTKTIVPQ